MSRNGSVDDGEFEGAIKVMLDAVDCDLLARAEILKAQLNGEIQLNAAIPLAWIYSAASSVADELDDFQRASNPVDPDREHRWTDAAEALNAALADEIDTTIHRALGIIVSCRCCQSAYTVVGFRQLDLVGRDEGASPRIELRNCPCREGGSTITAPVADLAGVKAVAA